MYAGQLIPSKIKIWLESQSSSKTLERLPWQVLSNEYLTKKEMSIYQMRVNRQGVQKALLCSLQIICFKVTVTQRDVCACILRRQVDHLLVALNCLYQFA